MSRLSMLPAVLLACCGYVFGKDLSTLMDAARVAREQPRLESRIREIYTRAFRPNLLPDEQLALAQVRFDAQASGDPLAGYRSDYRTQVVSMPASSLLFFEDLSTAYAWLYANHYRLETVEEYLTMLKYKSAAAFGGRYPPPLTGLQIPGNALADTQVEELSRRFRNSGWAFILGHELGHLRFRHPLYGAVPVAESQANEQQADAFALELMRRTQTIPMGALLFFQAGIFYFPNRADFGSGEEWSAYLEHTAVHPVTAERLRVLAANLRRMAPDFARGQPSPAAATTTIEFIGGRFEEFAKFLADPLLAKLMRVKAEQLSVSSLAPRRQPETAREYPVGP